jgi:hypothetical protein
VRQFARQRQALKGSGDFSLSIRPGRALRPFAPGAYGAGEVDPTFDGDGKVLTDFGGGARSPPKTAMS